MLVAVPVPGGGGVPSWGCMFDLWQARARELTALASKLSCCVTLWSASSSAAWLHAVLLLRGWLHSRMHAFM